jgi:hypothetical protein
MKDEIDVALEGKGKKHSANPIGTAECLVNWEKRVIKWGFGHVDDEKAISRELVRKILPKCLYLGVRLCPVGTDAWAKKGHGHGGLIRKDVLHSSPGGSTTLMSSVYPFTAKHNLRRAQDDNKGWFQPSEAFLQLSGGIEIKVDWEDLGWIVDGEARVDLREGKEALPAFCQFGVDLSVGNLITDAEHPACVASHSFERVVRKGFKLEKGMKVGIAVKFSDDSKPNRESISREDEDEIPESFGDDDLKRYFGETGKVNIYTGEIKYVGPTHIEYSINSFTGCAGCIVFLLDQDQPPSVDQNDWGKAIAIHSGAHPTMMDRNFGFLINEHPIFSDTKVNARLPTV